MNEKQITDLIERMRELGHIYSYQGAKILIREYEKLNKPEKVKIPQMVAEWLKKNDWREETKGEQSVFDAVDNLAHDSKNGYYSDVKRWIDENGDLFARAWLDGYTVEEEKKYKITLLNRNDGDLYLINQNADLADKYGHFSPVVLLFTKCTNFSEKCYKLTKKEVVSYDFGWVFDCPGIKIEEVKDE